MEACRKYGAVDTCLVTSHRSIAFGDNGKAGQHARALVEVARRCALGRFYVLTRRVVCLALPMPALKLPHAIIIGCMDVEENPLIANGTPGATGGAALLRVMEVFISALAAVRWNK